MKIAVMSDSHDNTLNIDKAVAIANERNCEWLFHLGDMVSPFAVEGLKQFKGLVKAVFGNCDGERCGIRRVFNIIGGDVETPPYKCTIKHKRFILMHEPFLLDEVIKSQEADYIFYGHLHKVDKRQVGRTYVLNPGETGGWLHPATFFIVDTDTNRFDKIEL